MALRAEVDRLKSKVNAVVSSAEATLRGVQDENDEVRAGFVRKEELYLRELRELEQEKQHYKGLYDVMRAEYEMEQRKHSESTNLIALMRESMRAGAGIGETKDQDDAFPSSSSSSSASHMLAHPGQLILRSTNSWAVEVAKLRRTTEGQTTQIASMDSLVQTLSKDLSEHKEMLRISRAETAHALAMLNEFNLAQSLLGKPRSRDQQLLSSIRAALSSSSTHHGSRLSKDIVEKLDDEEEQQRRREALLEQSLDDLRVAWADAVKNDKLTLETTLERLTAKLAESRVLLSQRTLEVEAARRTLDEHIADKQEVLDRLAEEHEHAARWVGEKESLLKKMTTLEEGVARLAALEAQVESSREERDVMQNELQKIPLFEEENSSLLHKNAELEGLLTAMNSKCEEQQQALAELAEELARAKQHAEAEATKAFDDAMTIRQALAAANAQARNSADAAEESKRRFAVLEREVAVQMQEYQSGREALERKKAEARDLAQQIQNMRSDMNASNTTAETLQAKVSSLQAAVSENWREVDDQKRRLAEASAAHAALDLEKRRLEGELLASQALTSELRDSLATSELALEEVRKELDEKYHAVHTASLENVQEVNRIRDDASAKVSAAMQKCAQAEAREAAMQKQLKAIEAKAAQSSEADEGEKRKMETLIARAKELEAALQASQHEAQSKQTALQHTLLRLDGAEKAAQEARLRLEESQEQLHLHIESSLLLQGTLEVKISELENSERELKAEVAAGKLRFSEREADLSEARARATALQREAEDLAQPLKELQRERERCAAITRELEGARAETQAARDALDALRKEREEQESEQRSKADEAATRLSEMQALFSTKEARMKQILAFATENIQKLEAAAVQRDKDTKVQHDEISAQSKKETEKFQARIDKLTQDLSSALASRDASQRGEHALARQLKSMQARHSELEASVQAKAVESARQMSELAERMHSCERQAKYFERQAQTANDVVSRCQAEMQALKDAHGRALDGLDAAREHSQVLLRTQSADSEGYLQEMEALRAKAQADLVEAVSALSAEFETSSRQQQSELWKAQQQSRNAEQKLEEARAALHELKEEKLKLVDRITKEKTSRARDLHDFDSQMKSLKEEAARAAQQQLEGQREFHQAELSLALEAQRADSQVRLAEMAKRLSDLERHCQDLESQTGSVRVSAMNLSELEMRLEEETIKSTFLAAEVQRLNSGFREESEALQAQLDQRNEALEQQQQQLVEAREAAERLGREVRLQRDSLLAEHAQALTDNRKELEADKAALSVTLAQTRNEMLVMLKTHVEDLDKEREKHDSAHRTARAEHNNERLALKAELQQATSLLASERARFDSQLSLTNEQHEQEKAQLHDQLAQLSQEAERRLTRVQALEATAKMSIEEATTELKAEADKAIYDMQQRLKENESRLAAVEAEAKLSAESHERERAKLTERAIAARKDQHAALEAHERALVAALDQAASRHKEQLAREHAHAVEEHASLQQRVMELEASGKELVSFIAGLQRRVDTAEAALQTAKSDAATLQAENASMEMRLNEVREAARQESAAVSKAHAKTTQDLAEQQGLNQALRRSLSEAEERLAASTQLVAALKQDLATSRAESSSYAARLEKSEAQGQAASVSFSRKLTALESKLEGMKAALDSRVAASPALGASPSRGQRTPTRSGGSSSSSSSVTFMSPTRQTITRPGQDMRSEVDSPTRPSPGKLETPGFSTVANPDFLSVEEVARAEETMDTIRAALPALLARTASTSGTPGSGTFLTEDESAEQRVVDFLKQSVSCYDTLKQMHRQAEEEYNAAARILIDTAEANRIKLNSRVEHYKRKLDLMGGMYSKLKVKLVNERLEYREELENLRLRLLSGAATLDASFGTGFSESQPPSPDSSTHSDSPSTFSIATAGDHLDD